MKMNIKLFEVFKLNTDMRFITFIFDFLYKHTFGTMNHFKLRES